MYSDPYPHVPAAHTCTGFQTRAIHYGGPEEAINELVSLRKTDELLDLLCSMEESDSTA